MRRIWPATSCSAPGPERERLTKDPVADPFFTDETVGQGKRYRYTVVAIDRAATGPASPEAIAEPF
jgi:hypothetical protein